MNDLLKIGLFGIGAYLIYQVGISWLGPLLASELNQGGNYAGTLNPISPTLQNQIVSGTLNPPVLTNQSALIAMMGG